MEERDDIITLIDEEGKEEDFEVIMTLEVEGSEYAILAPVGADEEDAYVFKIVYDSDNEEEFSLVAIEDDQEYENVVAAYETLIDEEL